MRGYLIILTVLFALPVAAQTGTHRSTTTTAKKSATSTPSHPTAIIDTTAGKLTCTLFPDKAPIGASNFIRLAKGTKDWVHPKTNQMMHGVPLYNGTIFHRVIPQFMIQGGDPLGTGMGGPEGPGFPFKNETSPDLSFDRPGRLAYANAGPNTNASQFFVTEVPYPSLDGNYTIFGQCDEPSVEVVKKIASLPRDANDRPENPPKITKITILGSTGTAHHATTPKSGATPAPKPPRPPTKQQ
ncbi:MAG TPA: peptidylprolyl isomerase [Terriglobales bacterium]|jgi:peptidyl-prolyl cis-trans isomerase A (cyclophilin A)|nr:peptidylprolyl isomerase [Terriglobales bacterium]